MAHRNKLNRASDAHTKPLSSSPAFKLDRTKAQTGARLVFICKVVGAPTFVLCIDSARHQILHITLLNLQRISVQTQKFAYRLAVPCPSLRKAFPYDRRRHCGSQPSCLIPFSSSSSPASPPLSLSLLSSRRMHTVFEYHSPRSRFWSGSGCRPRVFLSAITTQLRSERRAVRLMGRSAPTGSSTA